LSSLEGDKDPLALKVIHKNIHTRHLTVETFFFSASWMLWHFLCCINRRHETSMTSKCNSIFNYSLNASLSLCTHFSCSLSLSSYEMSCIKSLWRQFLSFQMKFNMNDSCCWHWCQWFYASTFSHNVEVGYCFQEINRKIRFMRLRSLYSVCRLLNQVFAVDVVMDLWCLWWCKQEKSHHHQSSRAKTPWNISKGCQTTLKVYGIHDRTSGILWLLSCLINKHVLSLHCMWRKSV
jgi:hypothetical protein